MPIYSTKDLEALFTIQEESTEERMERLRYRGEIWGYRTGVTDSGPMKEVSLYPLLRNRETYRRARAGITSQAQRNLNERNTKKLFIRILMANFTTQDLLLTLTLEEVPTEKEAHRIIADYLMALRVYWSRRYEGEFKYLYVIEFGGIGGREKRVHFHVVISGMDRDDAEKIWGWGRANSRRLQPDEDGSLEGLARYITKEKEPPKRPREGQVTSWRSWGCSRNVTRPEPETRDRRVGKRKIDAIAMDARVAGKEIFEDLYPEYKLVSCEVKTSDFAPGAYIYAKLLRRREPGGWSAGSGPPGGRGTSERRGEPWQTNR